MTTNAKSSKAAQAYLSFLGNAQKVRSLVSAPDIDAGEEALLNELMLAWSKGTPYPVREAMGLDRLASPSTLHRRIGRLKELGLIKDGSVESNQRIKLLSATPKALAYFDRLGKALGS